ncbi:hypothetical protein ACHAW6_001066 [Cyclotella cf. meneghiniana]
MGGSPAQDDCGWCKGDEIGRVCPEMQGGYMLLSEIRELKKGAARKLIQSGVLRQLWCFELEHESYVHSHISHDISQSDGCIPKMVVLGERPQTLAHSVNLSFGIGSSFGRMVLLFQMTKWYLASTLALVLMWVL